MTQHIVGACGLLASHGLHHLHMGKPFFLPPSPRHSPRPVQPYSSVPLPGLPRSGCLESRLHWLPEAASHPHAADLLVWVCVGSVSTEPTDAVTLEWAVEVRQIFPMTRHLCRGQWERPSFSSGSGSHPPESRKPGTPSPVSHPRTCTAQDPPRDLTVGLAPALHFPGCRECWAHCLFS